MKKFLVTLLLGLFTLPALAGNSILIVGDSISAGYGIDVKKGWTTLLEQRLQDEQYSYTVVNASVSGATTSNGLTRLPALLAQYKPTITIIELGGNDGLRGLGLPIIKQNLHKMITLAKNADSAVLLLGVRLPPNYGPDYTGQFQQIFTSLAQDENVSLVPLMLKDIDDRAELMQADRIHPTVTAQTIILNTVWPVLKPMLIK